MATPGKLAKPGHRFDYWFGSGPYRGADDIARRWKVGQQQLETLVHYCLDHPEEKIWVTPDGTSAIELEFLVGMGGVSVKGFIDQIVQIPTGLRV